MKEGNRTNETKIVKEQAYGVKDVVTKSAQIAITDLVAGEKSEFKGGSEFNVTASRSDANSDKLCDVGQTVDVGLLDTRIASDVDTVDCIFMKLHHTFFKTIFHSLLFLFFLQNKNV